MITTLAPWLIRASTFESWVSATTWRRSRCTTRRLRSRAASDCRLVPLGPALFLVVVPGDADLPGVVGRPALGRSAAGCDPPGFAESARTCPQPLPHLCCDVGRLGCLRPDGDGLHHQRERHRFGCGRGPRRGHQLRRVSGPDGPLHQGGRGGPVAVRVRQPHGLAALPAQRHDDGRQFSGRGRQQDRQERCSTTVPTTARTRPVATPRPRTNPSTRRSWSTSRGDDDRSQPLAAPPDRAHDLAERHPGDQRRSAERRSAMGRRNELRPAPGGGIGQVPPLDPGPRPSSAIPAPTSCSRTRSSRSSATAACSIRLLATRSTSRPAPAATTIWAPTTAPVTR
jgi:hypothetical protein